MTDLRSRLDRTLGSAYTIDRELSGGGMSHVFVAEERAFGRRVVVKVLREDLTEGVSAERFKREISVAAKLQHPHIVPLLTAGEDGHTLYYTMPYVDGESLRDRLTREGELPVTDAIRVVREVATALAYAHRRGIIHRDIKPENVLFSDGSAVVTDFGIAKALEVARTEGDVRASTITQFGVALGTPAYMSPEQAAADPTVDHRADLYALGCVAYELLAGRPPFEGRSSQQLLAAHATETPTQIAVRRTTTPPQLAAVVMQCLEKRAADRPQSAEDVLRALDGIVVTPSGVAATRAVTSTPLSSATTGKAAWWRSAGVAWGLGIAIVAAAGLGGVAIGYGFVARASGASQSPTRFVARVPAGTFLPDVPTATTFALAPNGSAIVYVGESAAGRQLYIKQMSELGAAAMPGTAGATSPFYSPNGQWVAFFSSDTLKRLRIGGGPIETVVKAAGDEASWGADGSIVYQGARGLEVIPADGGPVRQITKTVDGDSVTHGWPFVLPSGDAVLFTVVNWNRGLERAMVAIVSLKTLAVDTLIKGAFNARLLPSGDLLFARPNGTLEAARFDLSRRLVGKPVPVLDSVRVTPAGETDITVANNGTLVYLPASTLHRRLMRVDRSGHATPLVDQLALFEFPTLSPNGKQIAVRVFEPSGLNIWIYDLDRATRTRLQPTGVTSNAAWTPDSREIAAVVDGSLYRLAADGSGAQRVVLSNFRGDAGSWTPDGSRLVVTTRGGDRRIAGGDLQRGIAVITPGDSSRARQLVGERATQPALSHDGRWLAYVSSETGRAEVYVRNFDGGARRWPVSNGGGSEPRWRQDGRELFYRRGRQVIAVPVDVRADIAFGAAQTLFEQPFAILPGQRMWDVTPTGFVMVEGLEVHEEFIIVLDWLSEVSKRLGR